MAERARGLASQALLVATASGLAQVVLALLYLLAARSTTPAQFGVVIAASALGQSVATFYDFGTSSLWVREIARDNLDRSVFSARLRSKFAVLALGVVAWTATGAVLGWAYWWVAPASLLATVFSLNLQIPLRAAAQAHLAAAAQIGDRLSAFAVFALFWLAGAGGLDGLAAGVVIGPLVGGTVSYFLARSELRPILIGKSLAFPWAHSWHYGIAGVAGGAQTLDIPLLGAVAGSGAAGIYGAVSRWTQPMGLLATAFATASVPFVARASTRAEAMRHALKASWILGVAGAVAIAVAVLSEPIVSLLLGARYASAAPVLTLLALGTIPAICNQPLASFLQTRGHDRYVAYVTVAGAGVQLVLIAGLAPIAGALGAAVAFLVLQVLDLLCLLAGFRLAEPESRGHQRIRSVASRSGGANHG